MFVPSLACAMPVCAQSLKSSVSLEKPCHEHEAGQKANNKKSDHIRFVIDCMGVDLQKADAVSFDKANIQLDTFDHMFISDVIIAQNIYKSDTIIRGPPPDFGEPSYPTQSLILTTQRLRI